MGVEKRGRLMMAVKASWRRHDSLDALSITVLVLAIFLLYSVKSALIASRSIKAPGRGKRYVHLLAEMRGCWAAWSAMGVGKAGDSGSSIRGSIS